MTKPADTKKSKLSVKKSTLKDLNVTSGKDKEIKGGAGQASKPATPALPGCRPC